jgi:hypothetical protein
MVYGLFLIPLPPQRHLQPYFSPEEDGIGPTLIWPQCAVALGAGESL